MLSKEDDTWTEWEDRFGQGLIHQAVLSRKLEVVEQLCGKNARLGLINNDGMTSLHLASKPAEKPMVEYLLIQASDRNGDTALHLAAMSGDVEILHLLAEHGARPDFYKKSKQFTLHLDTRKS